MHERSPTRSRWSKNGTSVASIAVLSKNGQKLDMHMVDTVEIVSFYNERRFTRAAQGPR